MFSYLKLFSCEWTWEHYVWGILPLIFFDLSRNVLLNNNKFPYLLWGNLIKIAILLLKWIFQIGPSKSWLTESERKQKGSSGKEEGGWCAAERQTGTYVKWSTTRITLQQHA